MADDILSTGYVLVDYIWGCVVNLWWLVNAILTINHRIVSSVLTMFTELCYAAVNVVRAVGHAFLVIGCFFADVTVAIVCFVTEIAKIIALAIVAVFNISLATILLLQSAGSTVISVFDSAANTNPVLFVSNRLLSFLVMIVDMIIYCADVACGRFLSVSVAIIDFICYCFLTITDLLSNMSSYVYNIALHTASYTFEFIKTPFYQICSHFNFSFSFINTFLDNNVDEELSVEPTTSNEQNQTELFRTLIVLSIIVQFIVVSVICCIFITRRMRDTRVILYERVMRWLGLINTEVIELDIDDDINAHQHIIYEDSSDSDNDVEINPPALTRRGLRQNHDEPRLNIPLNAMLSDRWFPDDRERMLCVVCQENNKSVLLLPCRHLCLCPNCSNTIVGGGAGGGVARKKCPLCRAHVTSVLNVFT